jgi:H+-transporting ATPase
LPEKKQNKFIQYLKMFWGPMPIMIWLAIIVEFAIQQWADAGILLFIQFANATLGWYETVKAADAVAALKAALKPLATVKRDGKWQNIDGTLVVPGDLCLLGAGAAVPADCIVNEGRIEVDQSALTGESLPVTMYKGDTPKMGSTITRGETEGTVEFTGANTFFGKTATLLQGDNGLGNLQKLLLKIMFVLVAISLTLCLTALFYLIFARDVSFKRALSFAVVLLVASIPIAIEIVSTTTLALGSRELSKYGAIVSRLQAIEEMAGMNMLCSDKTGTLTLNKMMIQDYCPTYGEYAKDMAAVVQYAAMAAKWKEPPKDALDTMVLGAVDMDSMDAFTMVDHTPFDPTLKRTESHIKGPDGKEFKVTKGAPQIISKLVNDDMISQRVDAEVHNLGSRGIRALAVARTIDDQMTKWTMLGVLTFLDPPRPDTKATVDAALEKGVDVKMITGDQVLIAKEMSRILGLGTNIPDAAGLPSMDKDGKIPKDLGEKYGKMILEADGFAQVYPEHKFLIVEALRQQGFAVGMTGDGVNDAPALKKADVGIAVSGATDAARAAADIVLTEPGLSVVIHAIVIARCIFQRVKNFINYRIAATLQLLLFFFITVFAFHPDEYYCNTTGSNKWLHGIGVVGEVPQPNTGGPDGEIIVGSSEEAWNTFLEPIREIYCPTFFSLPVILLMLITVLNDGTLISIGYDNVNPSPRPEKWNLRVLFLISSVLGTVSMGSSLLLVWAALDSPNPGSLFDKMGLPVPDYGQVVMMIYLKVSLSDFLTLFSARTNPGPFWSMVPGKLLMGAATISLAISTVLACIWPTGKVDEVPTQGLVIAPNYYSAHVSDTTNETCLPGAPNNPCTRFSPDYYAGVTIEGVTGVSATGTSKNEHYTLWPLWVWLFCVIFWWIQDACKVIAYYFIYKYDIFQARTAALVNLRDAARPDETALSSNATGMVEKKFLGRKVDNAIAKVEEITRTSLGGVAPPALQRVSLTLNQARTSIAGPTQISPQGVDGQTIADINAAAGEISPYISAADQAALQQELAGVNAAAANLQRVSAVLARVSATPLDKPAK